jgi:hypothetical protein
MEHTLRLEIKIKGNVNLFPFSDFLKEIDKFFASCVAKYPSFFEQGDSPVKGLELFYDNEETEDPKFTAIVDDIVALCLKLDEERRKVVLIHSYRLAIQGNPGVVHVDRKRVEANVLKVYQQAALKLGYTDIDFTAEAEKL